MKNSVGQKSVVWTDWWGDLSPEDEIRMWDYYGGRQWISKYVPRFGKVIEAGCGLGRYNFYFSRFGIDVEGVDFSKKIVDNLNSWRKEYGFNNRFFYGDVTDLPYKDYSLSGYISLGVVEHFIEGPHRPLKEAFRVLRPGGVAIITTPAVSWYMLYSRVKRNIKQFAKRNILGRKTNNQFFQYEYSSGKLKEHINNSGLQVTEYSGADILFPFAQAGKFSTKHIHEKSLGYYLSKKLEHNSFNLLYGQAITVSVKVADKMYCFLSGEKTATPESLNSFAVPISKEYQDSPLAKYYKRKVIPRYAESYIINPPINQPIEKKCDISGDNYMTDELFENYGFNMNVSPNLLTNPEINIKLCNENIQPIWRKRKK